MLARINFKMQKISLQFHVNFKILKCVKFEFHTVFTIFKKSLEIGENGISHQFHRFQKCEINVK